MQEGSANEIALQDMKGTTLKNFVAYMYGTLDEISPADLLPLFLAADGHQVVLLNMACMSMYKYMLRCAS